MQVTNEQVEAHTLLEIEAIMLRMGKSLKDIDGTPLLNTELLRELINRLVNEELDYCTEDLKVAHDIAFSSLITFQKKVYDAILASVYNDQGDLIFING